jgi:hypothetical protein
VTPELWTCPACGRPFANPNQQHSCHAGITVDSHFAGRPPELRATFDTLEAALRELGPLTVEALKSRIGFKTRMCFCAAHVRRDHLHCHVVLARTLSSPRFRKVTALSPRNIVHEFALRSPADIDAEVRGWLAEAYAVGNQEHLAKKQGPH